MSAPNLSYENVCYFISDDDMECGNVPETTDERIDCNRYYGSSAVDVEPYLKDGERSPLYHRVVITNGYYEGACIDYIEQEGFSVSDNLPYCECTNEEITLALTDTLPLSAWRVRQLMSKASAKVSKRDDYWSWLSNLIEETDDYLKEKEAEMCERICAEIARRYGYKQYVLTGVMSNGEGVYAPADNPLNLRKPVKRKRA